MFLIEMSFHLKNSSFFRVFNRDRLREKRGNYEDTIVNDVLYDYKFNLIKFVYDISKVDSIE